MFYWKDMLYYYNENYIKYKEFNEVIYSSWVATNTMKQLVMVTKETKH